jgi:hypothetical protein
MRGLPISFLVVAGFVVLAGGLIIYFTSKQFLFRHHKRKGEEALQRRDYVAAFKSLTRAEALWDLNVTKQTTLSYQRDLAILEGLLNGLETAAYAAGITLAVGEYRDAVKAMQAEFQGCDISEGALTGKTSASAFRHLKSAQSTLREQVRSHRTNMPK